jgi:hypothetical protein
MPDEKKPMGWEAFLPLIIQYGVPYAFSVWQIVTTHAEPTPEAWDKLLAISQKPLLEYLNESRAKIGLPPLAAYDPRVNPVPVSDATKPDL